MKLLVLIIFLNSCSSNETYRLASYTQDNYNPESISNIMKNPYKYDDKTVELQGYFYHGLEYTSIAEKKYSNPSESIWISFNFKIKLLNDKGDNLLEESRLENISGKKIKIKGTFNVDKKGHLGIYAGSLTNITYISVN